MSEKPYLRILASGDDCHVSYEIRYCSWFFICSALIGVMDFAPHCNILVYVFGRVFGTF